jgi:hypothetical protein
MSRTKLIVAALLGLLVATNAWLAYRVLDGGISLTYLRASHDTTETQLTTAVAIINELAKDRATPREVIVRAAQAAAKDSQAFEKGGAVWVGQLGLRFNQEGRLIGVITAEEERQ